jgi:hypothetical protein
MWTFAIFGTINAEGTFVPKCGTDATARVDGRLGHARQLAGAKSYRKRHAKVWPKWAGTAVQFHKAETVRDLPNLWGDRASKHPTHKL